MTLLPRRRLTKAPRERHAGSVIRRRRPGHKYVVLARGDTARRRLNDAAVTRGMPPQPAETRDEPPIKRRIQPVTAAGRLRQHVRTPADNAAAAPPALDRHSNPTGALARHTEPETRRRGAQGHNTPADRAADRRAERAPALPAGSFPWDPAGQPAPGVRTSPGVTAVAPTPMVAIRRDAMNFSDEAAARSRLRLQPRRLAIHCRCRRWLDARPILHELVGPSLPAHNSRI